MLPGVTPAGMARNSMNPLLSHMLLSAPEGLNGGFSRGNSPILSGNSPLLTRLGSPFNDRFDLGDDMFSIGESLADINV